MKVVCISNKPIDSNNAFNNSLSNLIEGEIYTVLEHGYMPNSTFILKEAKSTHPSGGFNSNRFREVDYEFGEKVCNEIIEKIKEDELVCV
jgi:hypothetical protein